MSLEPGAEIAGYRIEQPLARGGMGEVYLATQLSLDRKVALKLIAPELTTDPEFKERFRREAKAAAAIEHPHILPIYETGETPDGVVYIAMRYVSGRDLGEHIRERGRLTPHETVALLKPIGEALDAAHAAGLVHRDVKPANVLLEERPDGTYWPYLADFGLAKRESGLSKHTSTGEVLGTVDYMAPEQAKGEDPLDGRVDVYAFGCMVYKCLVGEPPYPRESSMATMLAHVNDPVPSVAERVPGVPEALEKVVQRALEKDRERRARSALALMRWAEDQIGPIPADAPTVVVGDVDSSLDEPDASTPSHFPAAAFAGTVLFLAAVWTVAYVIGASL